MPLKDWEIEGPGEEFGGRRSRQRRKPETVQLRVAAKEYQALSDAARAKRIQVATLILGALRVQGLLGT